MQPVNVNDVLKVEFDESDLTKRQVECKILKMDDDELSLDYSRVSPYYYQFLHEGEEIKLYYYSEDGIYIFESIIITSPVDQKFIVEYPPIYTRVQRRRYTRAYTELAVQIHDKNKGIIEKTRTINIAGNGIKFASKTKLTFGKIYDVYISMSDSDLIKATGAIIKIEGDKYVLEFTKIRDVDRDKILKLCINIQSKNINRKKNSLY